MEVAAISFIWDHLSTILTGDTPTTAITVLNSTLWFMMSGGMVDAEEDVALILATAVTTAVTAAAAEAAVPEMVVETVVETAAVAVVVVAAEAAAEVDAAAD